MATQLLTPGQASYIFDLGGPAPRPKNLFFVRFVMARALPEWQRDISFMVRSIDRPSITPKVEELNQYNKKRTVYTGYSIGQVRMVLYDTADSKAMQMWSAYSNHYFGDFRNPQSNWDYDVTSPEFLGSDFGFSPNMGVEAGEAQFFFSSIEIFQVFRNQFVQTTLVRPRIATFEPDDLDYSNSEFGTFSVSVASEAVLYRNDGNPLPLTADQTLLEIFQNDIRLRGDVFEPDSGPQFTTYVPQAATQLTTIQSVTDEPPESNNLRSYSSSQGVGTLNGYSFGSVLAPSDTSSATLSTDLSTVATTNSQTAAALGVAQSVRSAGASNGLRNVYSTTSVRGISGALFEQALGAVNAAANTGPGSRYNADDFADATTAAVLSASATNGQTASEQIIKGSITLTPDAYGLMNAQRSATAQIGVNTNISGNTKDSFTDGAYAYNVRQQKSTARMRNQKLTETADTLGLPQGPTVEGKIEADIVTLVSRGGTTVDVYETLSMDDKRKVDAYRAAIAAG